MDIALVTGADAGPGLAIARRLIGMGCRVYALATQFSRNPFPHDEFITLACNLADPEALTKVAEDIVARDGHITYVVHAARQPVAPLFDSPVATLVERINVGLLAPLALARVTLPWLRKEQGHFLVLCWNGDGPAPGGPVSAAIEGGLHHFTEQLFDELRSDGVRATTLYARPNAETPPEALYSLDPQSAINPELVADTVEVLFRSRPTNVISSLMIRPAAIAETPRLHRSSELAGITTRDVQLPPRQNFPTEPESIETPVRARPADAPFPAAEEYFEEEDEEDDDWDSTREPLPWAPNRDAPAGEAREPQPPQQGGGQGQRPPQQRGYDPDRGHSGGQGQQGRGRGGRRGRGRGRGRGGDRFDDRRGPPNQNQPQRPQQGDNQPAPIPARDNRQEYPDPEQMDEERSFARDDSFRTPHSESDEDQGGENQGGPENSGEREFREESFDDREAAPIQADERREPAQQNEEPQQREQDFRRDEPRRDEPHRDDRREHSPQGQGRHPQDNRSQDQRPQGGGNHPQDNRPQGGSQQSHGGGNQQGNRPRRHRGYGRRPPPGGGGSRDRE